jgi:hypothetical protein
LNFLYSGWINGEEFLSTCLYWLQKGQKQIAVSAAALQQNALIRSYKAINCIKLMKSMNVIGYKQTVFRGK